MRVNQKTTLMSFASSLGDKVSPRVVAGGAVLLPKGPNTAMPNTISVWEQPTYVPPKNEYVRPGANDFLAVKSKGNRT